MRYVGDGVGHLIHSQSGWQGNNDADVNDLPNDDFEPGGGEPVAPDLVIADDPADGGPDLPDVDMPGEEEEDAEPDSEMKDADDDELDEEGSGDEGEKASGDEEEEEDESEDEDGNLFDDEGFLDI